MVDQREQVADVYRYTFAPRLDDFPEWLHLPGDPAEEPRCLCGQTGCHWNRSRRELSVDVVLRALTSTNPVSAYMEDHEGNTHVGAIDFDLDDGWARAILVARLLRDGGAHPYVERSRRGAHLWIVSDGSISGTVMRFALRWAAGTATPGDGRNPKVEVLPKKLERRGPDTVGSPLRMPMMAHPYTGHRFPLCDADGQRIGQSMSEVVAAVEQTSADLLQALADAFPVPVDEVIVPDRYRRPAMPAGDVLGVLASIGLNAVPGRSVRCPLHDDRHASLSVSRDGERVWCKAPACIAYNEGHGLGANQLAGALNHAAA